MGPCSGQGSADEDLLPPPGQRLLRVPVGGSQRGDEREGPGEKHQEGGQQQPDGEERQRHDRDLWRQRRSFGGAPPGTSPGGPVWGIVPWRTLGGSLTPLCTILM